jgi:hypothetical protein
MDRLAVAVALLAAVVVAGPSLASLATSTTPIQGETPLSTDQTPTVILASTGSPTNVDLVDYAQGTTLDIETAEGNMTVTGDTGVAARIATPDITGTKTTATEIAASSGWLELNPEDKNRVDVRGDATNLSFQAIGVDDGSADLTLGGPSGGSADLRLYGLSADTNYTLVESSTGTTLATFSTDGSGTGTATVGTDGTQSLEVQTESTSGGGDDSTSGTAGGSDAPGIHVIQWATAFVGALWLTARWLLTRPQSRWRHIFGGLMSALLWLPVAYASGNVYVADQGRPVQFGSPALGSVSIFMVVVCLAGLLVGLYLWVEEAADDASAELPAEMRRGNAPGRQDD